MKKKHLVALFIFWAIVCAVALAYASPFIVADPSSSTKYRMRLSADNGTTWSAWTEGNAVDGMMKFDVAGTPNGTYLGEAQAWGDVELTDSTSGAVSTVGAWSVSAPFVFKVRGQKVVNIKVIE